MKRTALWMVGLLFFAGTAFAEGAITLKDAQNGVRPVAVGEGASTTDDETAVYEMEGLGHAATVPCPTCHTSSTGVSANGPDRTALAIAHGGLVIDVEKIKNGKKFEVVSPTAIAAVRGTRFGSFVEHEGTGETYVVARGAIEVTVPGKDLFRVEEGQALDIRTDGTVLPRVARPEELDLLESAGRFA